MIVIKGRRRWVMTMVVNLPDAKRPLAAHRESEGDARESLHSKSSPALLVEGEGVTMISTTGNGSLRMTSITSLSSELVPSRAINR